MPDIRLLKPHTHNGRDYPPDAVLTVDAATAAWLLAQHIGVVAAPDIAEPVAPAIVGAVKDAWRAITHPSAPPPAADTDTTGDDHER